MLIQNSSSPSSARSRQGLLYPPLLLLLLGLGVAHGLVDGEDGTCGLGGCLEGVDLHKQRLPDEGVLVVADVSDDVDADVDAVLVRVLFVV